MKVLSYQPDREQLELFELTYVSKASEHHESDSDPPLPGDKTFLLCLSTPVVGQLQHYVGQGIQGRTDKYYYHSYL